jgi:hypothetical protein
VKTCDYAACERLATEAQDGWDFCSPHLLEHRADMHGAPWPRLQPVNLRHLFSPPCGTPSAARAHYRRGEKPCDACLQANQRDRNPHNPDGRRGGGWYRQVAS